MFFEGCPAHLGCSIKLRGASEYELARVKEIMRFMVCVAYHSQLEISFLMDEFAMPPSLSQSTSFPCLLEGSSAEEEATGERLEKSAEDEDTIVGGDSEGAPSATDVDTAQDKDDAKLFSCMVEETMNTDTVMTMSSTPFKSPREPCLPVPPPFIMDENQEMVSDTLAGMFEAGELESCTKEESTNLEDGEDSDIPTPKLFRDPLQDDTGMFVAEEVASSDDHLKSISAIFKQELKDIILCISPFITFEKPFLLTPAGMHCPSRDYFPEQVPCFFFFTLFNRHKIPLTHSESFVLLILSVILFLGVRVILYWPRKLITNANTET